MEVWSAARLNPTASESRLVATPEHEEGRRRPSGRAVRFSSASSRSQGLVDHPAAHDKEKEERHPVVVPADVFDDGLPRRPARGAHDELEQAEGRGQPERLPAVTG